MPTSAKVFSISAVALFCLLAIHSYFHTALHLESGTAKILLFVVSLLACFGFLFRKDNPLPTLIDNIWVAACVMTIATGVDFLLRLGFMEGALLKLLPIHVFTIYGGYLIETKEEITQEQAVLLWGTACLAIFLCAVFNY